MPRHSDISDEQMLSAALSIALTRGYQRVTRDLVAARVKCSPALVSVRFGTMPAFRRKLMRFAIQQGEAVIVGQGIAARDGHALRAPQWLKEKAILSLAQV